jgi:hypothetical protein
MTELSELEQKLSAMSPGELEARRRQIVETARGDYESLSVNDLQELSYIVSTLRRRNSGPPKTPKTTTPKSKPTIDSLLEF